MVGTLLIFAVFFTIAFVGLQILESRYKKQPGNTPDSGPTPNGNVLAQDIVIAWDGTKHANFTVLALYWIQKRLAIPLFTFLGWVFLVGALKYISEHFAPKHPLEHAAITVLWNVAGFLVLAYFMRGLLVASLALLSRMNLNSRIQAVLGLAIIALGFVIIGFAINTVNDAIAAISINPAR